jgi:2-hydroxyglutarate dehydrogenase
MIKNIKKITGISLMSLGSFYSYDKYNKYKHENNIDDNEYDIGVIGGGIVGLATARQLKINYPNKKMILLEKDNEFGSAQTGHNSGVIHAGMYYKPNSLKAKLCVKGAKLTYDYCDKKNIPYKKVGKLIVAKDNNEIENLKNIYERALVNKVVDVHYLKTEEEIKKVEPHCRGINAIHCKSTGIVDWKQVANSYKDDFEKMGGKTKANHEVFHIKENKDNLLICSKNQKSIKVKHLITCAGIYSDRISFLTGCSKLPKMMPFRGEYLLLNSNKKHLINGNIYPVPDPRFPFLGVHFTPRLNGDIWLGPNAIMGFSREGYSYFDINLFDLFEQLTFSGFWNIASKYTSFGLNEMYKSIIIKKQVEELQKYIPEITVDDVKRGPSGVRAQAVDENGNLIEDFVFDNSKKNILHVRNAPSPGATSSLAIAEIITERSDNLFNLSK